MAWTLKTAVGVLLGGWFGSWALFAFVVAPKAFQLLPSLEVAGDLVSPVLAALHNYGIVAGLALGALAWVGRRGAISVSLPLLLAAICAVSEYGVTAAIAAVEPRSFGPAMEPEAARSFSELHQTSRVLFGLVGLGVLALIGLWARSAPPATRSAEAR